MPTERDLVRENSSSRVICDTLDRLGPRTQAQLARQTEVTISCACKCLKLLSEEGYVRRVGQTNNVKGVTIGKLPFLYARTIKQLPDVRADELPAAPNANDLRDIMNEIIRRQASATAGNIRTVSSPAIEASPKDES
jgi:predicted ArsR family transcriptional regulator